MGVPHGEASGDRRADALSRETTQPGGGLRGLPPQGTRGASRAAVRRRRPLLVLIFLYAEPVVTCGGRPGRRSAVFSRRTRGSRCYGCTRAMAGPPDEPARSCEPHGPTSPCHWTYRESGEAARLDCDCLESHIGPNTAPCGRCVFPRACAARRRPPSRHTARLSGAHQLCGVAPSAGGGAARNVVF